MISNHKNGDFHKTVTDIVASFAEQGFVLQDNCSDAFVKKVAQAFLISQQIHTDSRIAKIWKSVSGSPKHLVAPHLVYQEFTKLIFSEEIQTFIYALWGEARAYLFNSKISIKKVGEKHLWVPHQDSSYKPRQVAGFTVCVFLEDADEENGTIQIFPGSHKLGKLEHQLIKSGDCAYQMVIKNLPKIEPVAIKAKAGDILIMSSNMIHQSQENKKSGNRPIFIFEIEQLQNFAVDEYGRIPLMIQGNMNQLERLISQLTYQLSPETLMQSIKELSRKLLKK